MGLDERGGDGRLDLLQIAGKETKDLNPIIGFEGGQKAGRWRAPKTFLGRNVVNTKPLLAAYLTKKVTEKVKLQGAYSVSEVIRWAAVFLRGFEFYDCGAPAGLVTGEFSEGLVAEFSEGLVGEVSVGLVGERSLSLGTILPFPFIPSSNF